MSDLSGLGIRFVALLFLPIILAMTTAAVVLIIAAGALEIAWAVACSLGMGKIEAKIKKINRPICLWIKHYAEVMLS